MVVERDELGETSKAKLLEIEHSRPQWTRYLSTLPSYAQAVCAAANRSRRRLIVPACD
ncbi:hypothetical protein J6590_074910 [Homalodisca vitripennis]|nr:hypothetical protein J6590_074910 [Homalodisca vitripennis]